MNTTLPGEYVVIPVSLFRELLANNQPTATVAKMATAQEAVEALRESTPAPRIPLSVPNMNVPAGFAPTSQETLRRIAESAAPDDGRNPA